MNKRIIGTEKEELACKYLIDRNYKIIERNYRCKLGEIDIIAIDNECLVFIEVKYRSNNNYGSSIEAVNYRKQNVIRKVASYYIMTRYKSSEINCRFDVIGIDKDEITLIKNAF